MAYRVGEDEVRVLLPGGGDSTLAIVPFIAQAHVLTNVIDACAEDMGVELADDELWLIESNYAAYLYVDADPSHYRSKKTMDASASYAQKENHPYLDTIKKLLGPLGILNCLENKGGVIDLFWAGLPPSEQTDYVDRD